MLKVTKRARAIKEKTVTDKLYPVEAALQLLKDCSTVKFDESVDIAVNLGIDARKSDQLVRGATVLPNGTGKTIRVAVFARGDAATAAKEAGADIVGLEDLAEQIQSMDLNNIVIIATPDAMPVVSKLGRILGPRKLIPSPKVGTVTTEVGQAVANAKNGQVQYQADKNGIIHCAIGKVSFSVAALLENVGVLLAELRKAKPSTAKGIYLKKISLSTTMGPGITIDQNSIDA